MNARRATRLFTQIYQQEFAYVLATVRRLGVPVSRQEDLAHDVFLVVHKKLVDYDTSRPLKPWLFGIAYRVVLDHKRKASTTREVPSEISEDRAIAGVDGARDEQKAARALIMRALDEVPLERRVVFILHKLDGCAVADIAREFALPLHTVYARLRVANEEFTRAVRSLSASEETS